MRQQCGGCCIYAQKPQQHQIYSFHLTKQRVSVKSMSSTCKFLGKKRILVRIIQPHEREQVLAFIRSHYYPEEPLTTGSKPKQQDKDDEDWDMSHIDQGTCFMALQTDANNFQHIVGALISGPKGPNESKYLFEQAAKLGPTKLGHILQFLACVERDTNVCERFDVKKVLHIHALAVKNEMRGQNIGHRLIQEVLSQAKLSHFEMVTADCTSFYSAKLFERLGFQCINVKYYKEYVDANGKQVFKPDAPHECVKTFGLKLETE